MDKALYVAMSGAQANLRAQAAVSHNLANASTTGFKEDFAQARAMGVYYGDGHPTRAYALTERPGTNLESGSLMQTGRDLDIAVEGEGWIAVRAADGSEAYTRAGSLDVDVTGLLQTKGGHTVLGDGGPINIPPDNNIEIAPDGTVSVVPNFGTPNNANAIGRIKLVHPPEGDLVRGADGLFRLRNGQPAPADERVRLTSGTLEGSNVNVTDSMVNLISLARQFEMQVKLLQTADTNAQRADQLLSLNA